MNATSSEPTSESSGHPAQNTPATSWQRNLLLTINMVLMVPMYSMILCIVLYLTFLYYSPPKVRTALLLYLLYVFLDPAPSNGGWDVDTPFPFSLLRPYFGTNLRWSYRSWFRSLAVFRWVAEYYDVELVKCEDLDATKKNYMFVYHPHGVIGMGCNAALTTNGCGFEDKFPGIHRSTATLNASFLAPFFREWMLANGMISANKSTLTQQLTTTRPFRKSVVLVPGGAQEALHAHPGVFSLVLKKRKGFIKLALQTGCSVVPCLGFGENEVFGTVYAARVGKMKWNGDDGTSTTHEHETMDFLHRSVHLLQTQLVKFLTFSTPVTRHIIPNRCKITVVVGEPMDFDAYRKELSSGLALNPTDDVVDKCHGLYVEQLKKLYDEYKGRCGLGGVELEII